MYKKPIISRGTILLILICYFMNNNFQWTDDKVHELFVKLLKEGWYDVRKHISDYKEEEAKKVKQKQPLKSPKYFYKIARLKYLDEFFKQRSNFNLPVPIDLIVEHYMIKEWLIREEKLGSEIKFTKPTSENYDGSNIKRTIIDEQSQWKEYSPEELLKMFFNMPLQFERSAIKQWEIIEYWIQGTVWEKRQKDAVTTCITDDDFVWSKKYGAGYIQKKTMKATNPKEIHAVRRTSDNQVFIVNEIYQDGIGREKKPIKRFFIKEGVMYAQFNEGKESNDGCLGINSLHKVPTDKPVLFKTEDGVDIRKMDQYWSINIGSGFPGVKYWEPIENFGSRSYPEGAMIKTFSTKAAADEYVIMNKPCMSVTDLLARFSCDPGEKAAVIKLAKEKIK